jgi:hypothetical protein
MAVYAIQGIHIHTHAQGEGMIEAASQTGKAGNLVAVTGNTNTFAFVAGGAPAAAAGKIAVSAADGSNTTTPVKFRPVWWSTGETVIEVTALGVGSAALLATGKEYGYSIDGATGLGVLNLADTTNLVFRIIRLVPEIGQAVTDTNVRVYVNLVPAVRAN